MRTFTVIVTDRRGRRLKYPPLSGPDAVRCMSNLHRRGFKPVATTEAWGISETVTLKELRAILP